MIISDTKTIADKGTTYSSITITSDKTKYTFMKVSGNHNYVMIQKLPNIWRTPGKQFKSFDDAQSTYKNAKLKSMILVADSIL